MIEEFFIVISFIFISFIIISVLVDISTLLITMFITTLRAIYSAVKGRFNKK